MTRIADFMTNNLSNAGNISSGLSSIFTTLTAGEDIAQGDLVNVGSDGLAYYAVDPSGTATAAAKKLRPLSSAAVTNGVLSTTYAEVVQPAAANQFAFIPLAVGFALIWVRPTASGGNPYFAIYGADAVRTKAPTSLENVDASYGGVNLRAVKLQNGNIVVCYGAAGANPRYTILAPNGNVLVAPTVIETVAGYAGGSLTTLADGGFAFAYFSGKLPKFARYNASGVLQGALTQIDTITSNQSGLYDAITIAGLTGGGFVVAYPFYDGSTSTCKFGRYNAAGVLQGALVQYGTSVNATGLAGLVCATSDGGFLVTQSSNSTFTLQYSLYNAAGQIQGVATTLDASCAPGTNNGVALMPLSIGGVIIAWGTGSSVNVKTAAVNSSGNITGTVSTIGPGSGPLQITPDATGSSGYLTYSGNTQIASVASVTYGGGGVPLYTVANSNGLVGGYFAAYSDSSKPSVNCFLFAHAGAGALYVGFDIYYTLQSLTLTGVASAAAAKGNAVTVQFVGAAQLKAQFKSPLLINDQAKAPPGQAMSILGNTAIMKGIYA
ncbi:hypothetical protein GTP58_28475 [Duganella sp. CY15W]|uniref:hypothetical protein n=1 Tax=Duganella sp. CY15W TaxID=2692172 RepID=UPI00136E2A7F|nr:hypothetical protein [Duganella sp. CY15W]MYM32273.1 hypothetical protein [Duganella sp. CY15W]